MQHSESENLAMEVKMDERAGGDAADTSMLRSVKQFARRHLNAARGSHAWDHTSRVFRLCDRIGAVEGVDMAVLRTAAYLHDIGRGRQDRVKGDICHAREGARLAESFVKGLPLSGVQKSNILHCIESHRYRGETVPQTPEARVLFDADKLDAIGAIGVARAFLFAGEVGARLHNAEVEAESAKPYSADDTGYREFKVKLCKIKDQMLTAEGRKLARERHAFMHDFFNRFLEEYEGKR